MEAPVQLSVDLNDLTIEEVELIEDILDQPFESAFGPGQKRGKAMRALAFIAMRRDDPAVTMADVGQVKISALPRGNVDPHVPSVP